MKKFQQHYQSNFKRICRWLDGFTGEWWWTQFKRSDFKKRFRKEFDDVYGKFMKKLSFLGLSKDDGDHVVLTDRGAYWLHTLEDLFSIDYISKLWGTSKQDPWPEKVVL